jgi:hypothetical protein
VIVESLALNDESDELVWQFQSSGRYSSHSLYNVINFRGVMHVYIPEFGSWWPLLGSISFGGCCQIIGCSRGITSERKGKLRISPAYFVMNLNRLIICFLVVVLLPKKL